MTLPLTTTNRRLLALAHGDRAARLLEKLGPSDQPISYARLLDCLGLDDALWCCRAEPDLASYWRRFAVWCARQVEHLARDPRSVAALDAAERHAAGLASYKELSATVVAAAAAAAAAAWANVISSAAVAAIDSDWAAMRQRQAAAFRQLVTTGTLPELEVQP